MAAISAALIASVPFSATAQLPQQDPAGIKLAYARALADKVAHFHFTELTYPSDQKAGFDAAFIEPVTLLENKKGRKDHGVHLL